MGRKSEASKDIDDKARLHGADEKIVAKKSHPVVPKEEDTPVPTAPLLYPILSDDPKPGRLPSLPIGRHNA